MYKNHFGFSEPPFENNLDQRFLFFSSNHKEVSASLLYFIKLKKSFAMVCGDVGTGKTMLINHLLNKLPKSVHPIMIMNPDVGYSEILHYVAGILKIDARGKKILDLVDCVKAALVEASNKGERFVLIIDEAHLLSDKSIEQIRLLSNIETQEQKLFQILLLGQYELSYKLNRPELRQVRQRININRFLAPMDAGETIQYIDHRLKMAGSSFDDCFESNCRRLIFKMTNGVPRSINQLCDSALLACMTEKRQKVNRKILKMAAMVLRSDILFTPKSRIGSSALLRKSISPLAAFGACAMIVILLWIAGYWGGLGKKAQFFLHGLYPSMVTPPAPAVSTVPAPAASAVPAPELYHPISETVALPEAQPIEMQSSGRQTAEIKDPSSSTGAVPPEMKQPISETVTFPERPPIEMQSSGRQTAEIKDPSSSIGAVPPEMKQPIQTKVLVSPVVKQNPQTDVLVVQKEKTVNSGASSLSAGKDARTENQYPFSHDLKRVLVKNGDTLNGIASRFFPKNIDDGVRKILEVNPVIDDVNRIYAGQELIIPETGFNRKDPN